jgi:hypothetical protein
MPLTASTTSAYLNAAKSDFLSQSTPDVTVLDISDYDYKRPRVSSKTGDSSSRRFGKRPGFVADGAVIGMRIISLIDDLA